MSGRGGVRRGSHARGVYVTAASPITATLLRMLSYLRFARTGL